MLRVQALRNAVHEQARISAGCKARNERSHPAASGDCVKQIVVEAVVGGTRENSESFAAQELQAARLLEEKYYDGYFPTFGALLDHVMDLDKLDKQGLFKGSSYLNDSSE